MATTTTRLLLRKPDPDPSTGDFIDVVLDINGSMDKIDAAIGITICTSGTRPTGADRWDGRQIYETDTQRSYIWANHVTAWLPILMSRTSNGPYLMGTSTDTTGEGINGSAGSAAAHMWRTRVGSEANPRFVMQADGQLQWGAGGASSPDAVLSRTAANEISTSTGDAFKVSGDFVCGSENGINGAAMASGTDSLTNTSYQDWGGTTPLKSFSFTKRFTSTRIRIDLHRTFYSNASDTGPMVGVNINGTDYDVCQLPGTMPYLNARGQISGTRYIPAGIAAGTYTVTGRWKRASGSGTISSVNVDWVSIAARECN